MPIFCPKCGAANEEVAVFCASCGETIEANREKNTQTESVKTEPVKETQKTTTSEKKLYRSRTNKIVSGLSAGLADYFDVEVDLIRILILIGIFLTGSTLAIAYLVMWAVVPLEPENSLESAET